MAGPEFQIKFEGLDRLLKRLEAEPQRIEQVLAGPLFEEGEETIAAAKKLTPVDEGILRGSGHVQLPKKTTRGFEVEIGFGGPAGSGNQGETNSEDVGYAVFVHEDLNAFHTVGQAKYLEIPLNERRESFPRRYARRVAARLKRLAKPT